MKSKIMRSHEAPLSLMDEVGKYNDYSYALVHHFEKHEEYFDFFKRELLNNREVILDNSIFELKEAFDSDKYAEWIEKLQPNYYIVPDVLEEGYETMVSFTDWMKNRKDVPGMKIGTIQGQTIEEIIDCYKYMSYYADYVAISFDMSYYLPTGEGKTIGERRCHGRQNLVRYLIDRGHWNWNKPHHLLGCSLAREFSWYKNNNVYNIRSVDTSNPVIAGILDMKYNGTLGLNSEVHLADHLSEDDAEDLFSKPDLDAGDLELVHYNLDQFGKILN